MKAQNSEIQSLKDEVKLHIANFALKSYGMNDMKVTGKDIYSDNVGLCIIDLLGLEISVSKVSRVMEVVCKHIFNVNLKQLPSREYL